LLAPPAASHLYQGPNHVSYLAIQKGSGGRFDDNQISLAFYGYLIKSLQRRTGLAASRSERGKIMLSNQPLGRRIHFLLVQAIHNMSHQVNVQAGFNPAIENFVPVKPFDSAESRVEVTGDFFHRQNTYRHGPQMGIHAFPKTKTIKIFLYVKMRHLSHGMNTSVCSTGSIENDRLLRQGHDRLFQTLLNRIQALLPLPSKKWRPIILYGDLIPITHEYSF
jgi:hypothetical protein